MYLYVYRQETSCYVREDAVEAFDALCVAREKSRLATASITNDQRPTTEFEEERVSSYLIPHT